MLRCLMWLERRMCYLNLAIHKFLHRRNSMSSKKKVMLIKDNMFKGIDTICLRFKASIALM